MTLCSIDHILVRLFNLEGKVVPQRVCPTDAICQPGASHHHTTAMLCCIFDTHRVLGERWERYVCTYASRSQLFKEM